VLVMLLLGIGLVMLLSASFPSAYAETDGENPLYYFSHQAVFAVMGVAAMIFIGKINYQRFRALGKPLLYLSVILLALCAVPGVGLTRYNATAGWASPVLRSSSSPRRSPRRRLVSVLLPDRCISKKEDRCAPPFATASCPMP
jgi:cell division protein FtsW